MKLHIEVEIEPNEVPAAMELLGIIRCIHSKQLPRLASRCVPMRETTPPARRI